MAENESTTNAPGAGAPAASTASKPQESRGTPSAPRGQSGPPTRGPGGRGPGGRGGPRGQGGGRRFFRRRKVDYFSVNKIDDINYKDADTLRQFIGDRGKILPRGHTGLSARHQRLLKRAIKRARNIALLPFAGPAKPAGGGRPTPRPRPARVGDRPLPVDRPAPVEGAAKTEGAS